MKKISLFIILITSSFFCLQCDKNNEIHIIGIAQDKELGRQVDSTILANPQEYPILSKTTYPQAYQYIEAMKTKILNSGEVSYKDEFAWEVKIIKKDDVLNAFATPGGYIYIYTGLIKYLDKEDDLAGVMGHEIAHADQRHSIKQMEKEYGASILLSIVLGNNASELQKVVAGLAGQLTFLKFSRDAEREADDFSVKYLSKTNYLCNGAASFFQKMIDNEQSGGTPEFLSTHPKGENRVSDINKMATDLNCNTTTPSGSNYQLIKQSLP